MPELNELPAELSTLIDSYRRATGFGKGIFIVALDCDGDEPRWGMIELGALLDIVGAMFSTHDGIDYDVKEKKFYAS